MTDGDLNVYDPTADGETVEKVRKYLEKATADEVGRVKALEAAGQNRAGVMSWEPEKAKTPKDGDGYDRVPVEQPYRDGTPAAWGHGGLNEGEPGTDEPVEILEG